MTSSHFLKFGRKRMFKSLAAAALVAFASMSVASAAEIDAVKLNQSGVGLAVAQPVYGKIDVASMAVQDPQSHRVLGGAAIGYKIGSSLLIGVGATYQKNTATKPQVIIGIKL
jgi:opacity protein-like surface antigen